MIEINKIYNLDCIDGLKGIDDKSVDLTVTSPPYDNLRNYGGTCEWSFDIFKPIAKELYRVTKPGGVVVWVIGDAVVNNGETGSSFKQALYFMECGFKLHDTMIYEKNSSSFPAKLTSQRYSQIFEYMFIFSKGKIRNDIRLIADKRNKWAGWTNWGEHSQYDATGNLVKTNSIKPIAEFSLRTNIWRYPVSFNDRTGHPAVFPEKLAEDHILSWSLPGELVLDPFMGSGTTAKMAMMNGRNYIGFEKNSEYCAKSFERLKNYEGKKSESLSGTTTVNIKSDEGEFSEECNIVVTESEKDVEAKAALWKELTKELEERFNEQSVGILKNLKVNLSFASKANDKRVEKVLEERTQPIVEYTPFDKCQADMPSGVTEMTEPPLEMPVPDEETNILPMQQIKKSDSESLPEQLKQGVLADLSKIKAEMLDEFYADIKERLIADEDFRERLLPVSKESVHDLIPLSQESDGLWIERDIAIGDEITVMKNKEQCIPGFDAPTETPPVKRKRGRPRKHPIV